MAETFAVSRHILDKLKELGYAPDTSMADTVQTWWAWYTATASWYDVERNILGHRFRAKRRSVHPARFVAREWASTILDDDGTTISVTQLGTDMAPAEEQAPTEQPEDFPDDGETPEPMDTEPDESVAAIQEVDDWLQDWCSRNKFVSKAQMALERAFALGTSAMALWFSFDGQGNVECRPRRYDARMVLPLSWDDDEITECAFVTRVSYKGKPVDQLQCHVIGDRGLYHVLTYLITPDGKPVQGEGIIEDLTLDTDRPPFCILRPAIDNIYSDGTALGQSVFADAIEAIKGVDNAWDSTQDEIDTTKIKIFISDELIDVRDENGRPVPIPMSPDSLVYRKVAGMGGEQMLETFQPKIRVSELKEALNLALGELGALCGFGSNYLRFDKDGGLRTAKEVSSDNSTFARNIRKHENEIQPQLEGLLGCLVDLMHGTDGAQVSIQFDDSVISDTDTEKNMAMAEVGAGVMAPWEYRMKFFGEGEAEARAAVQALGTAPTDLILPGTLE